MPGPLYPNQQLQSVSLETFFRGQLDIPARMGRVQREFSEQFPNLFVPNATPGPSSGLRPFQLRDNDETRSLAISLNQATYIAFQYPGSEAFIEEATSALDRTLKLLEVDELVRVAYRYDNAFIIPRRDDGTVPLDEMFNTRFPAWLGESSFHDLDLSWAQQWQHGTFAGELCHEDRGQHTKVSVVLRAAVESSPTRAELRISTERAHKRALEAFETMITDDFRTFLKKSKQ